jgi:uncharacterized protein
MEPSVSSAPFPRPYQIGLLAQGERFHSVLSDFADEFLREAERRVGDLIDARLALLSAGSEEPPRSRGEYAVELLTFGILRAEHAPHVRATADTTIHRLAELWRIRCGEPDRKAAADVERGWIFQGILHRAWEQRPGAPVDDARLVEWLAATGEHVQEALRMRTWLEGGGAFWSADDFTSTTALFAAWFAARAKSVLGSWTTGVDAFRRAVLDADLPREDLFLVTRTEPLYHLNLLGSEVMNRGFRPGFESRSRKVVLVPGCLRSRDDKSCQARREGLDIACARCHPSCEVAALDRLGEEKGFSVRVVPHASTFTAWLERWSRDPDTALVAAACPLHLVPGGYEMRALGLPAQCVLLSFSGCRRHWDPSGTPTRLDRDRLLELVA